MDDATVFRAIEEMTRPQHNGYGTEAQKHCALRMIRVLAVQGYTKRYTLAELRQSLAGYQNQALRNRGRQFAEAWVRSLDA